MKRIRLTGNGLLKRYPSGKQHAAQSKNSHRVRRLRTSVIIGNEFHTRMLIGMPYGRTHMMKLKRSRYINRQHKNQLHPAHYKLPNRPVVRDKLLDLVHNTHTN